ncbi:MBL fold metallo-hydrolase [Egibacter rhizosphaerae]|uniref:MBL fold metallo-hydrolase n=1 Tax=Egibacter rhizosphaerae TaxID=1670831 RepID=A0A411YJU7_9ACTN|nr:MBL fold metallo-hydrolase [Egibacter rhizosphaerae]QBI21472.1 MBL fold metallo-hydrolase [Egibacter rhizosphaerae]
MATSDARFLDVLTLGVWQANCYVLGDRERGEAVVVDPGQDGGPPVRERLTAHGVDCVAILLTHGHLDHVWAVPELARSLDVPVLLHPEDRWLWDDPAAAFGEMLPPDVLERELGLVWEPPTEQLDAIHDRQRLTFAGFDLEVRHTPGHTPGSSVFLLDDDHALGDPLLLSGDLLFAGSVGRTDFPRGSWEQQLMSLKDAVLSLDDTTRVAPGHGPETTVGTERGTNPFLTQAR